MKKIILMMVAAILLCSCGGLTNISTPNSVALNQGNFKFIKTVTAKTNASYVLGIGGLSDSATEDVLEKLKITANLKPNQALADIRVKCTTKVWFIGFYITRTLTATASVVEFYNTETHTFSEVSSDSNSITNNQMPSEVNQETSSISGLEGHPVVTIDDKEVTFSVVGDELKVISNESYTRDSALEILRAINAGKIEDVGVIELRVSEIEKWYRSIPDVYFEVEVELRRIKKTLRNK